MIHKKIRRIILPQLKKGGVHKRSKSGQRSQAKVELRKQARAYNKREHLQDSYTYLFFLI